MRQTRETTKGLFQPSGLWLMMLAGLLLTVSSSGGQEPRVRLPGKFKVKANGNNPDAAQTVLHDDAMLVITNAAVDSDFDLVVQPLDSTQVFRLDSGMTNVTKGPRSGYRMLPHGTKFKKEIKITLPYDKSLIPPGSGPETLRTYFYDEPSGRWTALPLAGVDTVACTVTSLTDHFTDFINATVTVPDHPGLAAFNPMELKNIAAADPGAGIALIDPPQGNPMGTANLHYPLDVPPGRAGMHPGLSVGYSSSAGNSWMGLGWNLGLPCVSVDTRWGVPRYSGALETETYLLAGDQLTPLAHREDFKPREVEKTFRRRVEGSFERIVRHGADPLHYWWEVTDKYGVRRFYGGDPTLNGPADEATLSAPSGIFHWALREVRDPNGNFVRYRYAKLQDSGLAGGQVPGVDLYLQSVTYTGNGNQEGPYQIIFVRDRDLGEARRPDVQIDCRGGFKRVSADLLRRVDVSLNGSLIRRYEFRYREGAFKKTLLTTIIQYGEDGTTEFNRHTFDYFDEIRAVDGSYAAFGNSVDWAAGNDNVTAGLLGEGRASALSGTTSTSLGGHLYVGYNPSEPTKTDSAGVKLGFNRNSGDGVLTLMDVNGDGLPDKVFKTGNGFACRLNLSGTGANAQTRFSDQVTPLPGLSALSRDTSTTYSFGAEAYFGLGGGFGAQVMANHAETFTHGTRYLTDVNGDGFPDLVRDGTVTFGTLDVNGLPKFTPDSSLTAVPVGPGAVDANDLLENYNALFEEQVNKFPLQDTLRRWVAPYAGTVKITAPVALLPDNSSERADYLTADGVRIAIQLNAAELWSTAIAADDTNNPRIPAGVDGIPVQKGDRIYFRVQSVFDGSYDRVSWDPLIEYVGAPALTDVNGRNPYRAKASEDFTLAGRSGIQTKLPLDGTVRLTGDLAKTAATTDDITLLVQKNGTTLFSQTLPAAQVGTIPLSLDVQVAKLDNIQLRVKVDSPIDVTKIQWAPNLFYIDAPGQGQITDDQGRYLFQFYPAYDIDLYPVDTLTAPQESWTATQTGTLHIVPGLTAGTVGDGTVAFTVKKQGQLLLKQPLVIQNGVLAIPNLTLNVTQGDVLYFDYSTQDLTLESNAGGKTVSVYYTNPNTAVLVPSAFHSRTPNDLFPAAFRGWSVTGYNGNRDWAAQAIDESVLNFQDTYTLDNARVYPYSPAPTSPIAGVPPRWHGPDEQGWVSAGEMSSTRLGLKYISVPRPEQFAGGRGVTRLTRTSQNCVGGGAGGGIPELGGTLSASVSRGTSQSLVDFIDLNGDHFPDVIANGHVQYSLPTGGLENTASSPQGLSKKVRESTELQASFGVGGNAAYALKSPTDRASRLSWSGNQMASLGVSGNVSAGTSSMSGDLVDMNGDGLPDRVKIDGNAVKVALNLGYGFADFEEWGVAAISEGASQAGSLGGSIGFNAGIYDFAGGLNLSKNTSNTKALLIDMNGDGLPDRVRPEGAHLKVNLNTGGGFAEEITWTAASGLNKGISRNGNTALGGGFYVTFGIPLCEVACYLIINPGFDVTQAMARLESSIRDVDGDGYPDYVTSERDDTLTVSRNLTGKTNLLRSVRRPLGATISVDYTRKGNTPQDPASHWVLARTEVDDGHPGDGVDVLVTTYKYESGRHDRLEREFLGFARVTTEQRDGSNGDALYRSVVQDFRNDSVYTKGLHVKSRTQDAAGNPFAETENGYLLRDVATGNAPADPASTTATIFPMLIRADHRFFEGQAVARKSTYTTHEYDALGNVAKFFDGGDLGAQDDIEARVTYANFAGPYIVGKANSIQVFADGGLQRRREAAIDGVTGNVTQVRQYLADGSFAATDLDYFPNGNLRTVTGPPNGRGQRYALGYQYDPTVATYVVRITDSFGYSSTADYTFKYGLPTNTLDANQNEVRRAYDSFGRLTSVTGPYDMGGPTPTIRFEYHPEAAVPWAHTRHLDSYRDPGDPIETVLFTDGLKRAIQTKKDAAVDGQDVMTVSGRVIFDFMGRAIEQRYPVTEPLGTPGLLNPAIDPIAPATTAYDVLDRKTRVTIPDGTSTIMEYGFGADRDGVLQFSMTTIDANLNRTVSYHDVRDLMTALQEFNAPKGQTIWTSYGYDALRQLVAVIDDRGNTTRSEYDFFGRRTAIDSPDKGRTTQAYDLAGNVISRVTSNLRAQNKAIAYQYDFSRLVSITYPNFPQNNVTYEYGAPGAPFNRAGRIQKITDAGGTLEKFYGKLGETLKETRFIPIDVPGGNDADRTFTTQYVYDSFNRLQRMTYPDGELLTLSYDSGGMMRRAQGVLGTQTRSYVARMEYDKFGQKALTAFGNGITTNYSYNPQNRRIDTLSSAQPGLAPFQNLKYGYDAVGNILRLESQVAVPQSAMGGPTTQTFQYDSLYRLTHAEGGFSGNFQGLSTSSYTLDMDYDTLHNIARKSQSVLVNGKQDKNTTYTLDYRYRGPQPHAPTTIGKRDFAYDADGNQTSYDGKDDFGTNGKARRDIVWDDEDRMSSATDTGNGGANGSTTSFVYDHAGQRVIKRGSGHELAYVNGYFTVRNRDHQMLMTKHVLVGGARIAATAIGGTLTAAHQEVSFFYFHSDHLGSADYLSDGVGALRQHNEYFPFGETWVSQVRDNSDQVKENAYLFTGKEFDSETSLYYFGARYYDPKTSIWESADPLLGSLGSNEFRVLALKPFAYCGHDPVQRVDPTGMQDKEALEAGRRRQMEMYYQEHPEERPKGDQSASALMTKSLGGSGKAADFEYKITGASKPLQSESFRETVYHTSAGDIKITENWEHVIAKQVFVAILGGAILGPASGGVSTAERLVIGHSGELRAAGNGVWESGAGLSYGADAQYGNRVLHVLRHAEDIVGRAGPHGVFDGGKNAVIGMIDKAYRLAQAGGPTVRTTQQGVRTVYEVYMGGRVGYVGGQTGAALGNPSASWVKLILEGKKVISAFPIIPE